MIVPVPNFDIRESSVISSLKIHNIIVSENIAVLIELDVVLFCCREGNVHQIVLQKFIQL